MVGCEDERRKVSRTRAKQSMTLIGLFSHALSGSDNPPDEHRADWISCIVFELEKWTSSYYKIIRWIPIWKRQDWVKLEALQDNISLPLCHRLCKCIGSQSCSIIIIMRNHGIVVWILSLIIRYRIALSYKFTSAIQFCRHVFQFNLRLRVV